MQGFLLPDGAVAGFYCYPLDTLREAEGSQKIFDFRDEMEVLGADTKPSDLRDFLANLVAYVLEEDVVLKDGEAIGFSAEDKHTITHSPGVSLPEDQMTLKISYTPTVGDPEDDGDDSVEMDGTSYHIESIEEKELPIDPINAYNHMAIYLHWCMEHDLMGENFLAEYGEVVKQIKPIRAAQTCGHSSGRSCMAACSLPCSISKAAPVPITTMEKMTLPTIPPTLTTTPSNTLARSGTTPTSSRRKPTCSSPLTRTTIRPWQR